MPDHPRAPRRPQRPVSFPAFCGPAAAFAYDLFRFVSRPLQALTNGCAWWLIGGVLRGFSWTAALGGLACALVSLGVGFLFV